MAGMMITPEMQAQYNIDADGNPTGVGSVTQPAIPNPTPTATGKGPNNQGGFGMIRDATQDMFEQRRATGKGSASGEGPQPGPPPPGTVGQPAISGSMQNSFQQDPMAQRGVQSMGLAQPFYMANVSGLAQPQMAGQASYMRQMAGLGQTPMAQSPMVSPLPPAQFPPMQPPATFGGQPPAATGKGPGPGGAPSTGKLPQSQSPTPIAGGKMPSSGGTGYMPPQTPETGGGYPSRPEPDQYQAAVMPTSPESSVQTPISGGGGATQPEGAVMEKQGGGSTYGFNSGDVRNAQNDMIRRAIDAAAEIGPKS